MRNKSAIIIVFVSIILASTISSGNAFNYYSNNREHETNITKTKILPSNLKKVLVPADNVTGSSFGESKPYSDTSAQQQVLPQLFRHIENSVVQITSKVPIATNIIINGNPIEGQSSALGSGFIFDKQGHIITNYHVVQESDQVHVTFVDGNVYTADVIGKDVFSDLAVVQLDKSALSKENLTPLRLSDSSAIQVGQPIVVIGNPFGLSGSMTHGIISQLNRLLPAPEFKFSFPGIIQIDAATNPGNSGGPLLDLYGEVIGVTTAIASNTGTFSGIGFAIPSKTVQKIIPQLILHGSYQHAWLGIAGSDVTPDIAKAMRLNETKGVIVESVTPGSPADLARIKSGTNTVTISGRDVNTDADIIMGIDSQQIRKIDDIINYIDTKSVGQTVVLKLLRNGDIQNIDVKLAARPVA
jgi:S1-C subfamily serine protease